MENYYIRLGISRNASIREIKAAYKRLAFQYHPDKNPSDPKAEEIFKQVNAAYRVLSDPEKRANYDLILNYQASPKPKVTYYHPKTFRQYRPIPRQKEYVFDQNYFKYQAIAILIVLFISTIIISATRFNTYLKQREIQLVQEENNKVLANAHSKFNTGDFYGALQIVQNLAKQHPSDYTLYEERNKMVENLYQKARRQYVLQDYQNAIFNLLIVKEFQDPMRLKTWDYLANSFLAVHDYEHAAEAFEFIYLRDKTNLELILKIANLYHYELDDIDNALKYYSIGKEVFKNRQQKLYGKAFELIMNPHQTPDLYFNIFKHRARANYTAGNYDIAVTDCNWASFLRPEETEPYIIRANSYRQLKKNRKACRDYKLALSKGHLPDKDWHFCKEYQEE
ncbi:MAG: DnaJ domain-containing protein [Candidatus Cyclobacteriaceae bacterium M2_1C_046]